MQLNLAHVARNYNNQQCPFNSVLLLHGLMTLNNKNLEGGLEVEVTLEECENRNEVCSGLQ